MANSYLHHLFIFIFFFLVFVCHSTLSLDIPASVNSENDWLLLSRYSPGGATCPASQLLLDAPSGILTLTNTLIRRSFLTSPCFTTVEYQRSSSFSLAANYSIIRTLASEGNISFNNISFGIGGCSGIPLGHAEFYSENQFFNLLSATNSSFSFHSYSVSKPVAAFPWTPRRGAPRPLSWPPNGLHLAIQLNPPTTPNWQQFVGISVVLHYEIYDCLPVIRKWVTVSNNRSAASLPIEVSALIIEMLRVPNGAPDRLSILVDKPFNPTPWDGDALPNIISGQTSQLWFTDDDYDACCDKQLHVPFSYYTYLKVGYADYDSVYGGPLGPGVLLAGGASWDSLSVRTVVHDSDELERKGLEIRRVQSSLAPQLMENPLSMMITSVADSNIFEFVIDQAAKAGVEMLVIGYGADGYCGLCDGQMFNETWRNWFARELAYAHSRGLEVTAYTLMQHNGWGEDTPESEQVLSADGQRQGIACFATDWHAEYRKNVLDFIKNVSLDGLETDGQYEYAACFDDTGDHNHNGARGGWDAQMRATTLFNSQLKASGAFQSGADAYMFSGANRWNVADSDAGFALSDFWEYMAVGRLYTYDSSYTRLPASGMYCVDDLPSFALNQCGEAERLSCIDFALATFVGSGTVPYVRAQWLASDADPDADAIVSIFQNWYAFWKQFRQTLIGDFLHLVAPTNRNIDATLHVDAYTCAKEGVCGIITLVNPSDKPKTNGRMAVNLYMAGLQPFSQVWTQQVQDKYKWMPTGSTQQRDAGARVHTLGKDGVGIYEIALDATLIPPHSYVIFLITAYQP